MSLRRVLLSILFAPLCAAIFALACGGTSSDATIPPITGIVLRAETLTRGRGCGQGPGQVFKYAAVVLGWTGDNPNNGPHDSPNAYSAPISAAIFDCYVDGTFVQLPPSPNTVTGSFIYRVEVYVFDAAAYATQQQLVLADVRGIVAHDGNARDDLRAHALPTWTTTCSAGQQQDVQVLALCDPLSFGSAGIAGGLTNLPDGGRAGITLATDHFTLADGGVVACGDGTVPEAGAPQDAGDAGDAGDASPPPPTVASTYSTVTIVPSTGGVALPASDVTCPMPYLLQPDQQSADFTLDVTLKAADGSRVGHTTCTASAEPGRTSSATCNSPVEP